MVFPTLRAPFSELYSISEQLGIGPDSETYLVTEHTTGRTLLMKHISVPADQTKVEALIYSGAVPDEAAAKSYFQRLAEAYREELKISAALNGNPAIRYYHAIQIDEKENAIGYDVYLITEPLQSLPEYWKQTAMTNLQAINLGIDLCTSLEAIRAAGLLYRNVKPSNVFLTPAGHFVLGDLGYVPLNELDYTAMPDSQFCEYTAPELSDILNSLNPTADLYGVGMILYRIFNGHHAPFEDEQTSGKAAEKLRLGGEPLPVPIYADYELSDIILKACANKPEDRYQTPSELKQALIDYMHRNAVSDTLIVPPIITDDESRLTKEALEEVIEPVRFADVSQLQEDFIEHLAPSSAPELASQQPEAETPPEEHTAPPESITPVSEETNESAAPENPEETAAGSALEPADSADLPPDTSDSVLDNSLSAKPKSSKKRRLFFLIPCLLVAAAIVGALLFYRSLPVDLYSFSSTARTTDSITVAVDSSAASKDLTVTATDAYGNAYTAVRENDTFILSGLNSATQYTITVSEINGKKLNGTNSITVSTMGLTEILSFNVSEVYETGAEILLTASGPEPVNWSLEVKAEDGTTKTLSFSGHTARITGLSAGKTYTLTLLDLADYTLSGVRSCSFTTVESVTDVAVTVTATQLNALTLAWTYTGTAPESWAVTVDSANSECQTLTTADTTLTISDLTAGETYEITVSCEGMSTASIVPLTVTLPTYSVTAFEASTPNESSLLLHWSLDSAYTGEALLLQISDANHPETAQQVPISDGSTAEYAFTAPDPEKTYHFQLCTADGIPLPGASEMSLSSAALFREKA